MASTKEEPLRRNAVVLITDDNLRPPAEYLWRRLQSLNPRIDTDIVLVTPDGGEDEGTCGRALSFADLPLPEIAFERFAHISEASYYRLAIPEALRATYRRLLYLDIDILVVDATVFDLFDVDLRGHPFAACRDFPASFSPFLAPGGRPRDGEFYFDRYFNGGVMLIDADAFEDGGISQAAYDLYSQLGPGMLPLGDQTVLNLLRIDWAELSPRFNLWPPLLRTSVAKNSAPAIVHYYGPLKPWAMLAPAMTYGPRLQLVRHLRGNGSRDFLQKHRGLISNVRYRTKLLVSPLFPKKYRNYLWERRLPDFVKHDRGIQEYLNSTSFVDVTI